MGETPCRRNRAERPHRRQNQRFSGHRQMLPQRIMRERAGNVGGIRFDDHKTSVRRQFGKFGDFDILKTPVIHLRQIGDPFGKFSLVPVRNIFAVQRNRTAGQLGLTCH